jgi:hypothetical protein
MRIRRSIIIPAILTLGAAGSTLAGSALPVVAAQAPSAHVQTAVIAMAPNTLYYG